MDTNVDFFSKIHFEIDAFTGKIHLKHSGTTMLAVHEHASEARLSRYAGSPEDFFFSRNLPSDDMTTGYEPQKSKSPTAQDTQRKALFIKFARQASPSGMLLLDWTYPILSALASWRAQKYN